MKGDINFIAIPILQFNKNVYNADIVSYGAFDFFYVFMMFNCSIRPLISVF